jgi:PncC family amidohydrolase
MTLPAQLLEAGARAGELLKSRGETVAIAEGSAGGLISAALLAVPGASAYYLGGTVIYTLAAARSLIAGVVETPAGLRGATEDFALYLARSVAGRIGSTWGVGEGGAAGPANRYGDPAGHAWLAVSGPVEITHHLLTGVDDRASNMVAFATTALTLLADSAEGAAPAAPAPE